VSLSNAKIAAAAFLERIKRARQAIGNIRQEAQVLRSEEAITRRKAEQRDQAASGEDL
jgi:hypothetical protein